MTKIRLNINALFLSFFLILFYNFGVAQNLVPNPGFEKFEQCPKDITGNPQFNLIPEWTMPTMGTSDYFNSCSYRVGVPKNTMGYMPAHGGMAYAGIITMYYFDKTKDNNTREYLQVKLKQKLLKGQKYYLEFYYTPAQISKFTTDKIGAYLSSRLIDSSDYLGNLPYIPQIETKTGSFVSSSLTWTKLSGFFSAKGGEQYLILGNFRDNKETKWKTNPGGTKSMAYFFIDDVSVYHVFNDLEADLEFLQRQKRLPIMPEIKMVFDPENEYYTYNWYIFNNINFDFNDYEIKDNSFGDIDKIIKTLIINPSLNILISGHSDSIGNDAYNKKLSELRANEVANYIMKNGIPLSRIKTVGFGDKKPLIQNDSLNSDINRRVEFMFFEKR